MRQSPSRPPSNCGGSRPGTRERRPGSNHDSSRAMTPADVAKRTFRMRVNVASLSPAHFESAVCRFSPFEDYSSSFLPTISGGLSSGNDTFTSTFTNGNSFSRAAPSRPHTVVASLAEDLGAVDAPGDADRGPATMPMLKHPSDGESALSALLAERGEVPTERGRRHRHAAATGGFEFPSLTRVDMLRRGRRTAALPMVRAPAKALGSREMSSTPGLQLMASRIAPAQPVRSASVGLR